MISYQIQQLADFCSDNPVRQKIVFVPSLQAGAALGTALARQGTNWINLRFATPEDMAREISEPEFLSDGWTPLPKDADLIELVPIVAEFLSSPANTYFKNQPFSNGLLRSIHRTLRALRIAGTRPEELLRQRGSHKLRAIAQLYVGFQDCLENHQWYDGPDLFSAATGKLENGSTDDSIYAILDETPLPGLAKRFVHALTAGKILRIGRSRYGVLTPETIAAHGLQQTPLVSEAPCQPTGEAFLSKGVKEIHNLILRTSTGPEIEIRNTFAQILKNRWSLDSVEIACANPDYLNLAYDATRKARIPATFGNGVSILQTRPGQVLRAVLNWMLTSGDPAWLTALREGRLLNVDPGQPHDKSTVLGEIQKLILSGRSTSASELANLGARLLDMHVTTLEESEEPARDSLVNRLVELSKRTKASGTLAAMSGALLEVVNTHRFEARATRPGHLNVVSLDRAGFSGRDHVFILGLDNTSFPGAPGEDPLLLDHERSQISGDLEMLRTRPVAQTWHLVRLLGLANHANLSASIFRLADGQESEPASLFHHLTKHLAKQRLPTEPIVSAPDQTSDLSDYALSWARQHGTDGAFLAVSPWLYQGKAGNQEREHKTFTRYKGLTSAEHGSLNPARDILSASRLETLSRCPARYFWRYVLHIDAPEEEGVDPTRWLSPLDFGSLLHELYQRFMTEADESAPPSLDADTDRMMALLEKIAEETAQKLIPPNPLAYQVDIARLEAAAKTFLAEESKRPESERPRGFEVSFGFGAEGGLNHPEPISIDLGDTEIRLRGLIDRVDQTPDGYIIWDYKTGSAIPYDESDLLGGGTHLQSALYAHALHAILDTRDADAPIQSGYYFASDREHGRKMLATPPTRKELGQMLQPILGLAERGAFLPIQKASQCMFCEYKTICEKDQMLPRSITSLLDAETDPELVELVTEWLSN